MLYYRKRTRKTHYTSQKADTEFTVAIGRVGLGANRTNPTCGSPKWKKCTHSVTGASKYVPLNIEMEIDHPCELLMYLTCSKKMRKSVSCCAGIL